LVVGLRARSELARRSNHSIVLIERGRRDVNPYIHIPATFFKALQSKDAELVVSEPDLSLVDLPFPVPQGACSWGRKLCKRDDLHARSSA
jgi:choline dehydrogenase